MKIIQRMEAWFEFDRPVTRSEQLMFRILETYVVVSLVHAAWAWAAALTQQLPGPNARGLAHHFDLSFVFGNQLSWCIAGAVSFFLFLGFSRCKTGWCYLAALVLLDVLGVCRYSSGNMPHPTNIAGMTLLAIAVAFLVFWKTEERIRYAYGLTCFFAGLGYTLSAACKWRSSGLAWIDGRNLWLWMIRWEHDLFAKSGQFRISAIQEMVLEQEWLATCILASGLAIESVAILICVPRFRPFIAGALICMHAGIGIVMKIFFWQNILILTMVGIPWHLLIDQACKLLTDRWPREGRSCGANEGPAYS